MFVPRLGGFCPTELMPGIVHCRRTCCLEVNFQSVATPLTRGSAVSQDGMASSGVLAARCSQGFGFWTRVRFVRIANGSDIDSGAAVLTPDRTRRMVDGVSLASTTSKANVRYSPALHDAASRDFDRLQTKTGIGPEWYRRHWRARFAPRATHQICCRILEIELPLRRGPVGRCRSRVANNTSDKRDRSIALLIGPIHVLDIRLPDAHFRDVGSADQTFEGIFGPPADWH